MSSFLLEIGVEELPARFIDPALQQLEDMSRNMLTELRIAFGQIKAYGTPRRLALLIEGLGDEQQSLTKEVKGPAVKVAYDADGNLTKAALGFARGQKIDPQELIRKDVNGVDYVFAVIKQEGRPVREVLPQFCLDLITGLHFPKPMRWGDLTVRFARPIRWLVGLYNQEVIPFTFANLQADRITFGHRFLSKTPLSLNKPEDYLETLHKAYVIADSAKRKELIWQQICQAAQEAGGQAEENADLLDEVNNLLEWPTAFVGSFDAEFLRLPKEALVTPMREHQRYFPVIGADGQLLNKFVGVKNGTPDHLDIVRAGNEKVLRARLYDAAFFWDEDLKTPLTDRVDELKKIVWQESLGSIYGKVERIAALTQYLGKKLAASAEEQKIADRSAWICKADLVTSMVYEFTELQGVMGREYALQNGEGQGVAQAIFEHYLPRFAGDELPASLPGQILALADKMDSLVGCFGIGILPTGSQDPYALRRQALGIANIILNGKLILSLKELISVAYDAYNNPQYPLTKSKEEVTSLLLDFFGQRLKGLLEFAYDTLEAVLATGNDDLLAVRQKAEALTTFRAETGFEALLTAFNRANNLSKNYTGTLSLDPALFDSQAEKDLFEALEKAEAQVQMNLAARSYIDVLEALGSLRTPIDAFFEAVMVMVEDEKIKNNRLSLLKRIASLAGQVADLQKVLAD